MTPISERNVRLWCEIGDSNDLFLNTVKNRKKKNGKVYYENINVFDIEVTNYHDPETDERSGICYLWTFAITDRSIYYGRTMEDFVAFLKLYGRLRDPEVTQVVFVHNLSYEFQFMRTFFDWKDVFLIDARRPLYAITGNFEFRCSYLLSNMSLGNFLKTNDCDIQKLTYDYEGVRFPWQHITSEDLNYCLHDTAGLWECINKVMDAAGDTIATLPYTSTGYVRRDIKKVQGIGVKRWIGKLSDIDSDLYEALKGAFVGGNTHANRLYSDRIIDDVYCYDITSSYPYCQMTEKYPVTPFREKVSGLNNLILDPDFAYLLLCDFTAIELSDYFDGMPVISKSKCIEAEDFEIDNGRILAAAHVKMWLTDIEYHVINDHYKYENVTFEKVYYSRYGSIPDCIKAAIYSYFENKTTLKGKDDYLYRKSKEKLNAIYGMSAFDIGKRRFSFEDGDYKLDSRKVSEILTDILSNTTQAEPYAWGVWTTAHARKNLNEVIRLAGDRFIYCDTDSVYVKGKLDLSDINEKIKEKSKEYLVKHDGKCYYLGTWKEDKYCKRFKTLGAKKYCYEDEAGAAHTVTAGVSKAAGVSRIEDYMIGAIFPGATNKVWYHDEPHEHIINGRRVFIPSSIYIETGDYTLGITNEYQALIMYMVDNEIIGREAI